MSDNISFRALLVGLHAGDNTAATAIFRHFADRLIALAHNHLDHQLRQKVDPEDILQSVFKSFFVRFGKGKFVLDGWEGLWALLTVLTERKCSRAAQRFGRPGRDLGREVTPPPAAEDTDFRWEALSREPTPDEPLVLAELVEGLMRSLNEREQHILTLALQGKPVADISREVDCTQRKVYRVLQFVRDGLEKQLQDGEAKPGAS